MVVAPEAVSGAAMWSAMLRCDVVFGVVCLCVWCCTVGQTRRATPPRLGRLPYSPCTCLCRALHRVASPCCADLLRCPFCAVQADRLSMSSVFSALSLLGARVGQVYSAANAQRAMVGRKMGQVSTAWGAACMGRTARFLATLRVPSIQQKR